MDSAEDLIDWAKTENITLGGITPHAFPGRGIGLIATRHLKEGEVILEIPKTCIKTLETIPPSITKHISSPPDMTVHGLLALDLALDASGFARPWRAVLPTREDISTIPLTWDARLQAHLPAAARELLKKQQAKFEKDLSMCRAAVPNLDEDEYKHAWLLVNSRTFYHTSPRTAKLAKEHHLSLQPVADLFNHAARGCTVAPTETSYTIKTNKSYSRGDEIPICYGRHSNDFLMVEYGFILADGTNDWDEASLDDVLLPRLRKPAARKRDLEEAGFWGRYVIDPETVCFRTQVAVRAMLGTEALWRPFAEGMDDGEKTQSTVDAELKSILEDYVNEIQATIDKVSALDPHVGEEFQKDMVIRRWKQILAMANAAIARLEQ